MSKLRWQACALLTVSALGLGTCFLWQQAQARQQRPPARNENSAPFTQYLDDDAIWARHVGNLKRIGLALNNYQEAQGHFPAAAITDNDGKPLLSWRVAILPYLEDYDGRSRDDLFKAFHLDEPWDSPHNKALLARMPAVFASGGGKSGQPYATSYRGFVASETANAAFDSQEMMMNMMGAQGASPAARHRQQSGMMGMGGMMGRMGGMRKGTDTRNRMRGMTDGMMGGMGIMGRTRGMSGGGSGPGAGAAGAPDTAGPQGDAKEAQADDVQLKAQVGQTVMLASTFFRQNKGVGLSEISDGINNTLMVVEAAEAVPWTKPEDLPFSQSAPLPRLGGSMRGGFAALFAGGQVRLLDKRVDDRLVRLLITPNGGEIVSTDGLPQLDAPPPGGVMAQQVASPNGNYTATDSHRYEGASTLENAVGILKDKLKREGKSELSEWLSEQKARKTVRAGLRTYETYLRRVGEPDLPRRQFEIVKPILEQVASTGAWPAVCWFSLSTSIEARDRISYDRSQVRLNLEGMDQGKTFHFSLLILDILSGPAAETFGPE